MVGKKGKGVSTISTILNITRTYSTVGSATAMRRTVNLARDFANKREAFGKHLIEWSLHLETLAWMEIETRVSTEISFYLVLLLGKSEVGKATVEEEQMLRLLTPIAKVKTKRKKKKN